MVEKTTVDLGLIEPVLAEYKDTPGSLIAILQQTQAIYGYLPEEAIYHIAEVTGTAPATIYGVATFYAQFRLEPVGKHLIMLCQGTACHVNG
ncbi:MAG: NAD(P)H-dependent oxidoreductase subunit E, partial [Clostridia bacterium]|nr:NAD(P)H-dependent oxidoreductase subunit E [Clostridia bacterium]MBQ1529014.1 NAD(P)H-dependent oxidoreductase subunit E [Clostridia bacterium]